MQIVFRLVKIKLKTMRNMPTKRTKSMKHIHMAESCKNRFVEEKPVNTFHVMK